MLDAVGVQHLPEIAFLIEQSDADDWNAEVARRLQEIAGQNAEPASIQRQGGPEPELHAEIGDLAQGAVAVGVLEPASGCSR